MGRDDGNYVKTCTLIQHKYIHIYIIIAFICMYVCMYGVFNCLVWVWSLLCFKYSL